MRWIGTWVLLAITAAGQVEISEVMAENRSSLLDENDNPSAWIELFNAGPEPVHLGGWSLTDDAEKPRRWLFPAVDIAPRTHRVVFCDGKDRRPARGEWHTNFRLRGRGGAIVLVDPDGSVASSHKFGPQYPDVSIGWRQPFTTIELLPAAGTCRVRVPTSREDEDHWTRPGYDDTRWSDGRTGVGYDTTGGDDIGPMVATDVGALMGRHRTSCQVRCRFAAPDPATLDGLVLQIAYRDGFVAWLNGVEIARRRAPSGPLPWDARATRAVSGDGRSAYTEIEVKEFRRLLRVGENLLAVQGLLAGSDRKSHLVLPVLAGRRLGDLVKTKRLWLTAPSPGAANGDGFVDVAPRVGIGEASRLFLDRFEVTLAAPADDAVLRYTLDGRDPSPGSARYEGPIAIEGTTELRVRAYRKGARGGPVSVARYVHLDEGARAFTSNLPVVVVSTMGRAIPDRKEWVDAFVHFVSAAEGRTSLPGTADFAGPAAIKIRGSSTLRRPKKAFTLELRDERGDDRDAALAGLPKDADWVLYGPYNYDQSHIRNGLCYELGRRVGVLSPRARFVEMFLADARETIGLRHHVGLYLLVEKITRGAHRVDVERLGPADRDEPEVSGGYILKKDRLGPGEKGFEAAGDELQFVYPKERRITDPQRRWITAWLDEMGRALDAKPWPTAHGRYIDIDSFIDYHFFSEYTKNPDALTLSTYFHKPRGGLLRAGPVWDFDRAMRTNDDPSWVGKPARPTGWTKDHRHAWWGRLLANPGFAKRYRERARAMLAGPLRIESVHALVDEIAARVAEAEERDRERWPLLAAGAWENEILELKDWIARRTRWLRSQVLEEPRLVSDTGAFKPPFRLTIEDDNAGGELWYTLDGSDPRLNNGELSRRARLYEAPLVIEKDTRVRTRARVGGVWGVLVEQGCVKTIPEVCISEFSYNPEGGRDYEFVELHNYGAERVDLHGLAISNSVAFHFKVGRMRWLEPGGYVLLVHDERAFRKRYGDGLPIAGEFMGRMSNTKGAMVLRGSVGQVLAEIHYQDTWVPDADGRGHTMVLRPQHRATTRPGQEAWGRSRTRHGSPGRPD